MAFSGIFGTANWHNNWRNFLNFLPENLLNILIFIVARFCQSARLAKKGLAEIGNFQLLIPIIRFEVFHPHTGKKLEQKREDLFQKTINNTPLINDETKTPSKDFEMTPTPKDEE